MEKLQKALAKARSERQEKSLQQGDGGVGVRRTVPGAAEKASTAVEQNWAALRRFEPDPAVLRQRFTLSYNADPEATPFDILRTKTVMLMRQNGWKRVGITSPERACGKTTVACNLALGISRHAEVRAVLMDFDMRRPNVANSLGFEPEHDIARLINGEVTAGQQMIRLRESVAVAAASHPVSDPGQLLFSERLPKMISEIEQVYEPDLLIFDLSPMLVNDDARSILPFLDCVMIIVRAEQTHTAQLDACEREVAAQTNVLGTVLNDCRFVGLHNSEYGDY